MIDVTNKTNEDLVNALKSGDQGQAAQALAAWQKGVEDSLRADFENYQATNDVAILNKRGIHTLTSAENKFYDALAENIRDKKPKDGSTDVCKLTIKSKGNFRVESRNFSIDSLIDFLVKNNGKFEITPEKK